MPDEDKRVCGDPSIVEIGELLPGTGDIIAFERAYAIRWTLPDEPPRDLDLRASGSMSSQP